MSKKTVVFFHAFASNKRAINSLERLENDYITKSFDFPGSGNVIADKPVNLEQFYKIASDFLDSIEDQEVIVMGHSLGGAVAMSQANHPKVKKIILMAPINFYRNGNQDPEILKSWLIPTNIKDATDSYTKLVFNKDKVNYFANVPRSSKVFLDYMMSKRNVYLDMVENQILNEEYATKIMKPMFLNNKKPVFMITGDHDEFSLTTLQTKMANEMNAKQYIIENCGHAPAYEYPEKVNDIINNIIKD